MRTNTQDLVGKADEDFNELAGDSGKTFATLEAADMYLKEKLEKGQTATLAPVYDHVRKQGPGGRMRRTFLHYLVTIHPERKSTEQVLEDANA